MQTEGTISLHKGGMAVNNRRSNGFVFLLLLVWVGFAAEATAEVPTFTVTGTMQFHPLQGGCWLLVDEQGIRYELVGEARLLQPLMKEGLRVTVEVREDSQLVGKCMAGRMVQLVRVIQARSPSGSHY